MELREFGSFKRDRKAMAEWVASFRPRQVAMESTGIYWKSPYAALEKQGIYALVVNARHVKQVPGRKTDLADAQWLAILARSGLLRGGFVPPQDLRTLRLISCQMQKLTSILSGEKNRAHKVLADSGIRLAVVVNDIHGKSAREMIEGLSRGETPEQVLQYASGRLEATIDALLDALAGESTADPSLCALRDAGPYRGSGKTYRNFCQAGAEPTRSIQGDSSSAANDPRHRQNGSGYAARGDCRRYGGLRYSRKTCLLGRGRPRQS